MSPIRHVLVTLTPQERSLIREAISDHHSLYTFTPAEEEIIADLLRRIPDPKDD